MGEYERSVNMGSPINQFGNNPEGLTAIPATPTNTYPQFWANVFGPKSGKGKGDAYQSNLCTSGVDNCSGTTNLDYDSNGYFYGVEVAPGSTGPLQVDVFDPEFAHVGDNCGNTNNLSGAAALPANFNPQFAVANPSVRYNINAQSPYCTGDMYYTDTGENGGPAWTTYQLRAPDDTPNDPTNNPVVCSINFPGYNGDLKTALQATTPQANAPALFVAYFRQWYRICTVNNPIAGNYFLQVQTATKADGSAAPQGSGANRFAVRAGLNGDTATPNLRVYGEARIGIYANSPAANTTFYLARVLPGAKGRNLVVNFFDTGDAAAGGDAHRAPAPRLQRRFDLPRLHLHPAARDLHRSTVGDVLEHPERLQDHQRELRDLQRSVDPVQDPDPRQLRLHDHRRERLLGPHQLRVPLQRAGHHHLDRPGRGRPRPPRGVVRLVE